MDEFEELPDNVQLDGGPSTGGFEELPMDVRLDGEHPGQPAVPKKRTVRISDPDADPQPTRPNVPSTNDPWAKAEQSTDGKGVAVFGDEATPFQGLKPEIEQGYIAIWTDMNSKPEDLMAYAQQHGFSIDAAETRRQYAERDRTNRPGTDVGYRKPPKILIDNGDGATGAFLRGAGDTATYGMLDELGGVADTIGLTEGRENIWNSDERFGDLLWQNIDTNRAVLGYDDANHGGARLGGQIAGVVAGIPLESAVGNAIVRGGAKAGVTIGRGGKAVVEGTLGGAAYGAGSAEGDDRLEGAAGGAIIGAGGTYVGNRVIGGLGRQAARDSITGRMALDAADDLNKRYPNPNGKELKLIPSQVGGTATRLMSAGSDSTVIGGTLIGRAEDRLVKEAENKLNQIAVSNNPKAGTQNLEDVGEAMVDRANPNSFINLPTRLKEGYDRLYEIAQTKAGNIKVGTPKTIAALDEEIARLEQVPGGVAGLDKLKDLRKALANGGSIDGLRRLRTSFGDNLEVGNRTVRDASKKLWGPLSDDISEGLVKAGKGDAADAYRRADDAFVKALDLKDVVESVTKTESGTLVAKRLNAMVGKGGDAKKLEKILQHASREEADGIRAAIMTNLGKNKDGFSLSSFLTNWQNLSSEAKRRVLVGQARNDLMSLAVLAHAFNKGRQFRNNSNTGRVLNVQNILRTVDAFGTYHTSGGSIALSGSLGLLLSSPGVAKTLVWWGQTGAKRGAVLDRLTRVATRLGSGQGADAVNSFIDFLKSEPEEGAEPAPKAETKPTELREDQFDHIDAYAFQGDEEEEEIPADDDSEEIIFYDENGDPITFDENGNQV